MPETQTDEMGAKSGVIEVAAGITILCVLLTG
jgi:hypothetical protein